MPVVARRGAEEAHLLLLRPRTGRVRQAVGVRLCDQIIHQVQTGVSPDYDLLRLCAEQLREKPFGGRNARQIAVIAHIDALVHTIVSLVQNR